MRKLFSWLKQGSSWAKVITTFIALGVGISTAVISYNKWIINRHEEDVQQAETHVEVEELSKQLSIMADSVGTLSQEVRSFSPQLNETNVKMDMLIQSDKNLRQYLLDHAVSKEEVLDIIEIWNIKKNSQGNLVQEKTASDGH